MVKNPPSVFVLLKNDKASTANLFRLFSLKYPWNKNVLHDASKGSNQNISVLEHAFLVLVMRWLKLTVMYVINAPKYTLMYKITN